MTGVMAETMIEAQNHTHTHDPPGADPVYVVANAVNTSDSRLDQKLF